MPVIEPIERIQGYKAEALETLGRLNKRTHTYAISDGTAIKVGRSSGHPRERLQELQVGNPRELQLLAFTFGISENNCHRMLRRHLVRGEWYASEPVMALIQSWDWLAPYET